MLSQSRAEAAQKGDEYEGAQASHASDLVFNHAALPLRSYESANENGDEEWIDISKVHMAPLFYCPVNSFAWLMAATLMDVELVHPAPSRPLSQPNYKLSFGFMLI